MRRIGVVTVARSDYGILTPILRRIDADPSLELHLIVAGMHLSPEFGMSVRLIEADGFRVRDRVELLLSSDSPAGIAKSMGLGTIGFADVYARSPLDLLVVLGDRFEMHAAAIAALPFKLPVAHIHGGELSFGAIDDALRHAITKVSHLHFASTAAYAERIAQMGEEAWRITVSGAPGLDNLRGIAYLSAAELERQFDLRLPSAPVLVTFHPVTLEYEQTEVQVDTLLEALAPLTAPIVFSMPNADTAGRTVARKIRGFVAAHANAFAVDNFGMRAYFSLMRIAAAMVGNSSSGIIEAASFGLPVVNIGNRQAGRIHGDNVIDVSCERGPIEAAIRRALDPAFRGSLATLVNPYGSGDAAEAIVNVLRSVPLDQRLIVKRFADRAPAALPAVPVEAHR